MDRIEIDVKTGELKVVQFTPDEVAAIEARAATEGHAEKRRSIEFERDAKLAEGALWNGKRWHMDDVMLSALQWRILRWQMGRLAPDATLPVRAMDNTINMLGRDEHIALAEAIEAAGGAIYAESWAKKDVL